MPFPERKRVLPMEQYLSKLVVALKAISEVSRGFDELQQFIEKSYRDRKYLR